MLYIYQVSYKDLNDTATHNHKQYMVYYANGSAPVPH